MVQRIGKYCVEKVLGAGAFGEVYRAFDPDLQISVAIKKLKARADQAADSRVLFTAEARDTSKLAHPNIVTVHGFGIDETDGSPYLVMELLEGETLERFIRRNRDVPLVQKIEIMHQVAEGLQFAHTRGVIHRDIKPANMMLLSDGTAKVMDFAVAPEGYLIGTPSYMAPEQFPRDWHRGGPQPATGHRSDVLTDVFAFGAVYYELLTGERAFDPNQPDQSQTSRYEPPPVSARVPECPAWLDLLVARLTAKRRDQRLDSLEEMLVETRPTLQKLKQQRAAELAGGIARLVEAGDQEAADRLIKQALRLDPLNRQAREWRGASQAEQREAARARAQELFEEADRDFDGGNFRLAQRRYEEALELDIGNRDIERRLEAARRKSEDARMADRLVDEVVEDLVAAGPSGMAAWLIETAFQKLTRAARLDERNTDASELRTEVLPLYERVCDRKLAVQSAAESAPAAGDFEAWYAQRLADVRRARKNKEFDYAEEILTKLLAGATDERAQREQAALAEDREAHQAAQEALGRANICKLGGDVAQALAELDAFAEKYPRKAKAVEQERRALEREIAEQAAAAAGPQ